MHNWASLLAGFMSLHSTLLYKGLALFYIRDLSSQWIWVPTVALGTYCLWMLRDNCVYIFIHSSIHENLLSNTFPEDAAEDVGQTTRLGEPLSWVKARLLYQRGS